MARESGPSAIMNSTFLAPGGGGSGAGTGWMGGGFGGGFGGGGGGAGPGGVGGRFCDADMEPG